MFDAVFGMVSAYNAVAMLFIGFVFFLFGGLMIGYAVYTRTTWRRVRGKIVAVRTYESDKSTMYRSVYEFVDADGKLVRVPDNSSSSILKGRLPGTAVRLLVNPSNPEDVRQPGVFLFIFGAIFAGPGMFLLAAGGHQFDFGIYSVLLVLAILGGIIYKISKIIKPRSEWETKEEFRERMAQKRVEKYAKERDVSEQEIRDKLDKYSRTVMAWTPVTLLLAFGLIAGGVYFWKDTQAFLEVAVPAQGEVVRMISEYDSSDGGGYTYYPVAGFETLEGRHFEFKDKVGSNPPSFKTGDAVTVLYDPMNPQKAWIDRGLMNWFLPGILYALGAVIFVMTLRNISVHRRRQQYRN
ncbi:MAG: DUF3592 domain-containing protein [Rhodospirillales bacterium]|nr:DUF3592 domain-containing protein [Rhodospirillales bacterium]